MLVPRGGRINGTCPQNVVFSKLGKFTDILAMPKIYCNKLLGTFFRVFAFFSHNHNIFTFFDFLLLHKGVASHSIQPFPKSAPKPAKLFEADA